MLFLLLSFGLVKGQNDSIYFEVLKSTAESFYYTNPDSTGIYADSIYSVASQKGSIVYMGEGKRLKGVYHQLRVESVPAKTLFEEAASLFKKAQDSSRFGRALLSIGLMEMNLGNYSEALDLLFQAKAISEAQENQSYTLRAVAEIGRVYSIQGDHQRALSQFRIFYNGVKYSGDLRQIGTALNYLSVEFKMVQDYDSSLFYLNKNLTVQKELLYPIGIASVLQNIATVYQETNDSDRALTYFQEAEGYYTEANFNQGIGQVKLNIAFVYMSRSNFKAAALNLEEAVKRSASINDYHAMRAQYQILSAAYDSLGQDALALASYVQFHAMSDTLLNIDKQRTLSELFTQYETKEKEQQIAVQQSRLGEQEANLQRNKTLITALIIVAILLVLIVLLVRNQALKKQALIAREGELKLREAEITAVINSQEKERNRFARDLHDGFGQLISVLKLNLSQLNEVTNRDMEKRAEVFKNGESVINEMFTELRNICFDLMPQTLVKRGLNSALKELGIRINQTKKVSCEVLVFDNSERLPSLMEISLFRITQEWVNNILKYASATHITVQLTREAGEITLTIEDNGTGFDPQDFYNGSGNGWKNIQTRLNQINGQFDLDSRTGIKSSMITVNVPLDLIPTTTDLEMAET